MVEASSGSTAISEAYFAALLGLPFIAVMPAATSPSKVALIESQGGRCHFVQNSSQVYAEAERVARRDRRALPGPVHQRRARHRLARQQQHRRVDLRADARREAPDPGVDRGRRGHRRNQRDDRPLHPLPAARDPVVRGRSGELGVLPRLRRKADDDIVMPTSSRIEGIGRPRVEPSFLPGVVDRMVSVPDAASIAAARHVSAVLGRRVGPSTGTNLWGAFGLLAEMVGRRPQRFGGHAAGRQRRPLRRHLLQRRVGQRAGARSPRTRRGTGRIRTVMRRGPEAQ